LIRLVESALKFSLSLGALLLVDCLITAQGPPRTALSDAESQKAAQYVKDLGDAHFRVRDTAARELKRLGRLAKPALIDGMKNTDPEIWNRCAQLLPEVMALDL